MVCANTVIVDISVIWFPNEWNCVHFGCTFGVCVWDDLFYWQCWLEMMSLDFCHVVFDGIVVIAPLYWGVNDVL